MTSVIEKNVPVLSGKDRFGNNKLMIWGLLPLSIKLSGHDTGGQVLMFEHNNIPKVGPPRHIHFDQDEWFYVIKGEFAFEVGEQTYRLHPGDTLFAPRRVAHGWTHVGDEPGKLLTLVSPVGKFETFILETTRHVSLPTPDEVAKAFADHDMQVVGPPLAID
jgi:quercetin dioxygenase-like cupin family protein